MLTISINQYKVPLIMAPFSTCNRLETVFHLLTLLSLPLAISQPALAQQVISDVDDTFKISNIGNDPETVRRALLQESFTGMIPFYQSYSRIPVFVSGTPEFLSPVMDGFLSKNEFQNAQAFMRTSFSIDTKTFKIQTITRLMGRTAQAFVLIGDDTEKDPEVYERIAQEFPTRVLAVYIRKVTGRALPAGQIAFSTALELAAHEWKENRITTENLERVLSTFENERRFRKIFPTFVPCPEALGFRNLLPESLQERGDEMEKKIMAACKVLPSTLH